MSLRIFLTRLRIMLALQHMNHQQIAARREYWLALRSLIHAQVEIVRSHFERMMVKLALPHLDKYRLESSWAELSETKITELKPTGEIVADLKSLVKELEAGLAAL